MSGGSLLAEALKPTLATSVWKTFRVLEGFAFLGASVMALPFEAIAHRRIGRRVLNPLIAGTAISVLACLGTFGVSSANFDSPKMHYGGGAVAPPGFVKPLRDRTSGFLFGGMLVGSVIALGCHRIANRRRFGTHDQTHSMDFGISTLCFPFGISADQQQDGCDGSNAYESPEAEPLFENKTLIRRLGGYPGVLLMEWRRHLKEHIAKIRRGEVPYGPIAWFTSSTLEPVLLLIACGLCILLMNAWAFGIYLALVAIALMVKASIIAAEWRERIYDENDQRIEVEAMKGLREGKSMSAISTAFTVPITQAVVTPTRDVAAATAAPRGFENLFRQPTEPDNREIGRNTDEAAAS